MYQSAKHGSAAIGAIRGPIVQPAAVTVGRSVGAALLWYPVACAALWSAVALPSMRTLAADVHKRGRMLACALLQVDSALVAAGLYSICRMLQVACQQTPAIYTAVGWGPTVQPVRNGQCECHRSNGRSACGQRCYRCVRRCSRIRWRFSGRGRHRIAASVAAVAAAAGAAKCAPTRVRYQPCVPTHCYNSMLHCCCLLLQPLVLPNTDCCRIRATTVVRAAAHGILVLGRRSALC